MKQQFGVRYCLKGRRAIEEKWFISAETRAAFIRNMASVIEVVALID
jgi:hypothetical protein